MPVILINLVPLFILIIGAFFTYRNYNRKKSVVIPGLLTLAILALYTQIQPSYMPKGEVVRSTVPAFEEKSIPVQDRLSKPVPGEERDEKRHQAYEDGLIFLQGEK